MATNGNLNTQDQPDGSSANLSKDQVGWYFVEQYYTNLSKNPEKLHLFHGKKSQFVAGQEGEGENVAVGRDAIQTRIAQLAFQECKVRISNVDTQASDANIVIQVIGEMSNKSPDAEPKKFVQTFVLAEQPSGYFVLNDILRYIKDEEEEEPTEGEGQETSSSAEVPAAVAETEVHEEPEAPKSQAGAEEKAQLDAAVVDQKLEAVESTSHEASTSTATPASPAQAAAETKTEAPSEAPVDAEKASRELAEEDLKKPEVPKDPTPTPVATRAAAPAAAEPPKPKEPPKPMTWASRAAAAAGAGTPRPVVPLPKSATPPTTQSRASVSAAAAAQPAPPAQAAESAATKETSSEWQTAGADSKRQRPVSMSAQPQEQENTLGYVKFVTEKVKDADLKTHLESFGEVKYFDINRSKNCAFVEFTTTAGYQAAISANPHVVNGENIQVEPRRPKAGAYGSSNYNQNRGSMSGRGRGGFDGGRSGSQGGGRGGGYGGGQQRGRGGAGARGRGGISQSTNA